MFRFTVATARASAALADGIATIGTGNAVLVANGVAEAVAPTTASGSVGSTFATIELRLAGRRCAPAFASGPGLLHDAFNICSHPDGPLRLAMDHVGAAADYL